jgi:hypothetical protein
VKHRQAFPISPAAAAVDGVRNAPTVFEANEVLHNAHFPMNLFGAKGFNPDVSGALGADNNEAPFVELTVATSRRKTFSNSCRL